MALAMRWEHEIRAPCTTRGMACGGPRCALSRRPRVLPIAAAAALALVGGTAHQMRTCWIASGWRQAAGGLAGGLPAAEPRDGVILQATKTKSKKKGFKKGRRTKSRRKMDDEYFAEGEEEPRRNSRYWEDLEREPGGEMEMWDKVEDALKPFNGNYMAPFESLGIEDLSTPKPEIRKAYRKLVRTKHPDINKEPGAAAQFELISKSYDLLMDDNFRMAMSKALEDDKERRTGLGATAEALLPQVIYFASVFIAILFFATAWITNGAP